MTESSENTIFLPSLAIGGYRSFGDIQYFEEFSKINLFIGRNNCGKSNVLRAVNEFFNKNKKADLKHLDYHLGGQSHNEVLLKIGSKIDVDGIYNRFFEGGDKVFLKDFLKELKEINKLPITTSNNAGDIYFWRSFNQKNQVLDAKGEEFFKQEVDKSYKLIEYALRLLRNTHYKTENPYFVRFPFQRIEDNTHYKTEKPYFVRFPFQRIEESEFCKYMKIVSNYPNFFFNTPSDFLKNIDGHKKLNILQKFYTVMNNYLHNEVPKKIAIDIVENSIDESNLDEIIRQAFGKRGDFLKKLSSDPSWEKDKFLKNIYQSIKVVLDINSLEDIDCKDKLKEDLKELIEGNFCREGFCFNLSRAGVRNPINIVDSWIDRPPPSPSKEIKPILEKCNKNISSDTFPSSDKIYLYLNNKLDDILSGSSSPDYSNGANDLMEEPDIKDILDFENEAIDVLKIYRNGDCDPNLLKLIEEILNYVKVPTGVKCIFNITTIKATRKISANEPEEGFADGAGMIQEINQHKNPTANEVKREKVFSKIQDFLRDIIAKPNAEIQIPHDLKTINVRIDGKLLPLESLGSGIEEIIIIAAAATLHENQIICIEEPELHLNPLLQKKLIRYLSKETNNQYFIATHSAALLDTPDAEIYHLELKDGQTVVQRATLNDKNREICADLGYHPSDFLQANCVIWVEGPTDRFYINWWLKKWSAKENKTEWIEGIHYSIMFYGGKLLSHLEGEEDSIEDRISLFRMNQRSVVVIDSDKNNSRTKIRGTKQRIVNEFKNKSNNGFAWVTNGREIENYLDINSLHKTITSVHSKVDKKFLKNGRFDNLLKGVLNNGSSDANKIKVAKYIIKNNEPDFSILDLEEKIKELYEFIEKSQPDTSLNSR